MKKILVLISLFLFAALILGCTPQKVPVEDQEGNLVGEASYNLKAKAYKAVIPKLDDSVKLTKTTLQSGMFTPNPDGSIDISPKTLGDIYKQSFSGKVSDDDCSPCCEPCDDKGCNCRPCCK